MSDNDRNDDSDLVRQIDALYEAYQQQFEQANPDAHSSTGMAMVYHNARTRAAELEAEVAKLRDALEREGAIFDYVVRSLNIEGEDPAEFVQSWREEATAALKARKGGERG